MVLSNLYAGWEGERGRLDDLALLDRDELVGLEHDGPWVSAELAIADEHLQVALQPRGLGLGERLAPDVEPVPERVGPGVGGLDVHDPRGVVRVQPVEALVLEVD